MFIKNEKIEYYSGYIRINKTLQIEEISGHIIQILRIGNIEQGDSLPHMVETLNKNIRAYFKEEILPAIMSSRIRHFTFERKKTSVTIGVTPIGSGLTILSIEEIPEGERFDQQSLPEKIKEIFIRINPDLVIGRAHV